MVSSKVFLKAEFARLNTTFFRCFDNFIVVTSNTSVTMEKLLPVYSMVKPQYFSIFSVPFEIPYCHLVLSIYKQHIFSATVMSDVLQYN